MTVKLIKPTIKQLHEFVARNPNKFYMDSLHLMMTAGDTPIGIFSATEHKSCIEIHLQVNDKVKKHKEIFNETCKEVFRLWFDIYDEHNFLVADVEPRNENWVRKLGFQLDTSVEELETIEGLKTYSLHRKDL